MTKSENNSESKSVEIKCPECGDVYQGYSDQVGDVCGDCYFAKYR